ncbi:hypothetical protein MYE70_12815 [Marinobacter alexandrii]|uniref:hypothetical protein n=1 Tax=Marinobacter alexandrii TaxID=2570351 RepID=UPI00200026E9|nr:hypothetical protein [Marinobacter alexandrii]MCK2149941.1 hypothetical protein [Marinobacter alexandrii]
MTENQRTAPPKTDPTQGAVLRQGRAADPLPSATQPDAAEAEAEALETAPAVEEKEGVAEELEAASSEFEQARAQFKQRELRLILRQCDRVLLLDFNRLAMSDWPDDYTLATARRNRDLWLFSAFAAAVVFVSGLTGFVTAWVAGTGFGAFMIILMLGIPAVRRIYTSSPSYLDVIMKRQRLLREARAYAAHLEGKEGLIWQCTRMADFNAALKNTRFSSLIRLSERRILPSHLTRREHVRLYLIYLLEAEKAYARVQAAFFEGNRRAIDQGWRGVAAEPEPRA